MALFSQKNKAKSNKVEGTNNAVVGASTGRNLSSILKSPRITEKAMKQGENNVYTFVVSRSTTKFDVSEAVKQFYGVTPVKVNIVNKAPRQFKHANTRRTRTEHGIKKAYVYLKKGDSISLI